MHGNDAVDPLEHTFSRIVGNATICHNSVDGSVVIFASMMGGIGVIDRAVQEWTGLLVYWIAGRILEPFGPM
jgi:hypothetical protein